MTGDSAGIGGTPAAASCMSFAAWTALAAIGVDSALGAAAADARAGAAVAAGGGVDTDMVVAGAKGCGTEAGTASGVARFSRALIVVLGDCAVLAADAAAGVSAVLAMTAVSGFPVLAIVG